ncbi:hypothetical protein [Desulfurivibrio alkaliphilus]|uniref:Right handed beta helix domain-containing protein n=1 Tax=Desulfurivibrio alkaliphilus (strain DSM 19089 / UNIQEM U267 / AHT2) TaxID=589865 RepID=D6Z4I9_DESAT|nr:hypothetical protein [Desulfurivibrio alkaliphilus]ADH86464.1 hypothetical protein DaAHT2_1773 [Desulfurivibrio alkaliphilus AHT 2]
MKNCKCCFYVFVVTALMLVVANSALSRPIGVMVWPRLPADIHDFTGLPLTEVGWTNFSAMLQNGYEDARVIFVSSSEGNDSTGKHYGISDITFDVNGMFQPSGSVNAYATVAAGVAQVRNGFPDILLLKRGDKWNNEVFSGWSNRSGPSTQARIILASYGIGPRPTLNVNANTIMINIGNSQNLIISGITGAHAEWEVGSASGVVTTGSSGKDILVEDCFFDRLGNTVQAFPRGNQLKGYSWRRNIFVENSQQGSLGAKFFSEGAHDLLFEENLFYSPVAGNRHVYIAHEGDNGHIELRRNIFYASQRVGVTFRTAGRMHNNLIVRSDRTQYGRNAYGPFYGDMVDYNVFLERWPKGTDITGLRLEHIHGVSVFGNIFTDGIGATNTEPAIRIESETDAAEIYENVVGRWGTVENKGTAISFSDRETPYSAINVYDNEFQMGDESDRLVANYFNPGGITFTDNKFYSPYPSSAFLPGNTIAGFQAEIGENESGSEWVKIDYPNPDRSLRSYNESFGSGTASTEEFMLEALQQSRYNWRAEYTACAVNDYIREGFGKDKVECGY